MCHIISHLSCAGARHNAPHIRPDINLTLNIAKTGLIFIKMMQGGFIQECSTKLEYIFSFYKIKHETSEHKHCTLNLRITTAIDLYFLVFILNDIFVKGFNKPSPTFHSTKSHISYPEYFYIFIYLKTQTILLFRLSTLVA